MDITKNNLPVKPGFENLRIWKKSYSLMLEVHSISKTLPREEKYILGDQAERSSSAVVDCIAEACGSYYYNDKIKICYSARREASETQSHLRKMEGKKYLTSERANELIIEYEGLIRGINAFINDIKKQRESRKK